MSMPKQEDLQDHARMLRKEMTKEERRLWYHCLRECPVKFYRQRVVGAYILDFYSAAARLAIELDGSQHYEPSEQAYDAKRTAYLNGLGIRVLRFSNADVMLRFESVCEAVYDEIKNAPERKRKTE